MTMAGRENGIAISLRRIEKRFPGVNALSDVSFDIPRGSVFGVLGPNGAGKTTLFSVIAGFLRPTSGSVTISTCGGISSGSVHGTAAGGVFPGGAPAAGKIGILPQDAMFQSNIPIIDQLTYFLRLSGFSKNAAYRELDRVMTLVGLDTVYYREAATLSHGMYKRLSLAQAFLGNPDILILDEPTAGLDVVTAGDIRGTIKRLKGNATILVSSHNMEEMQELCGHVAVLNKGRLVSVGPVEGIGGLGRGIHFVLNRPLTEEEKTVCVGLPGIEGRMEGEGGEYRVVFTPNVSAEDSDRAIANLQKHLLSIGVLIRSLGEDNRIEHLYREVTGKPKLEG